MDVNPSNKLTIIRISNDIIAMLVCFPFSNIKLNLPLKYFLHITYLVDRIRTAYVVSRVEYNWMIHSASWLQHYIKLWYLDAFPSRRVWEIWLVCMPYDNVTQLFFRLYQAQWNNVIILVQTTFDNISTHLRLFK